MPARLCLRVRRFDPPSFFDEVRNACGKPDWPTEPAQVRYLESFLRQHDMRPSMMLIEHPYIDRHYLEEFTGYYATALRPPSEKTTRIHFIAAPLDESFVANLVQEASDNYEAASRSLSDLYLGFMVVRPIAAAPVGRTVLRPYARGDGRQYGPLTSRNRVHLAGVEVAFEGVPFQQQDQGVAACATTALWSALAKVARNDGERSATPLEVTEAATRHLASGRVFPAGGLDLQQMVAAIRAFGYAPHAFKPSPDVGFFKAALFAYVRSGIPVILQVKFDGEADGHAIAVVGIRESLPLEDAVGESVVSVSVDGTPLSFAPVTRLYAHDDRLGPYARLKLVRPVDEELDDERKRPRPGVWLQFDPREPQGFDSFRTPAFVRQAIVPLYPKVRLAAEELIWFAAGFVPLLARIASVEPDSLQIEPFFALAGDYLRDAYRLRLDRDRLIELATGIVLSRYVGVLRFRANDTWVGDLVCDSTDIRREVPRYAPLLAVVMSTSEAATAMQVIRSAAPDAIVV